MEKPLKLPEDNISAWLQGYNMGKEEAFKKVSEDMNRMFNEKIKDKKTLPS